jgi:tetratricopeptide (TPR) repeat protein
MGIAKKSLILAATTSLMVSCSGIQKQKTHPQNDMVTAADSTPIKVVNYREYFAEADKKLDEMTAEARKIGPEAVEFLAGDLFLKGTDASMRGDAQSAVFLYKHVLSLKPNDLYVKRKYSLELIRTGNLADAKVVLEELVKSEGHSDEALGLVLGGVYTALEEKSAARQTYEAVLKEHPKSEEACVFLAKALGLESKYKQAHSLLDKCNRASPDKAMYIYFKGKLYAVQGKVDLAREQFKRALKVNPNYHQAALALGMMLEEKEKYKDAISLYKKFLDANPMSYPVLSRIVQVMFASQELNGVIPFAERLASLDSTDLNLKVRLGILYTDAKRFDDAKGVFKEILAAVPDSDKVLYYLGALHQQTSDFDNAVEFFSRVPSSSALFEESNLQIAEILMVRARDEMRLGRTEATERFTSFVHKSIEVHSKLKVDLTLVLTNFYESVSNYSKAIDSLSSIKGFDGYTEGHDYYLASLYEKTNEVGRARDLIRGILKLNPDNAHALNFLGYSLLEREEDMDEAFKLISRAVEIMPDDGYIRDSMGWFYYKVGKYDLALKELKRAWELVKTDVVITKHLAMTYQSMQRFELAKKFYMEALKQCKVESERTEVLKALQDLESVRLPASDSEAGL